jgi:hypothetical protein
VSKRKPTLKEKRYAAMRRRGVPEALLDDVETWGKGRRKRPGKESFWVRWGMLGMLCVCIGLMELFKRLVTSLAAREGAANGAWLVSVDSNTGGFALLTATFALIFWLGARLEPEEDALRSAASLLKGRLDFWNGYARWMTSGIKASDAQGFLAEVKTRQHRRFGMMMGGVIAASAAVLVAEVRHFTVANERGVVHHRLLPPFTTSSATWDQAVSATLECGRSEGRYYRGPIRLRYVFRFDNGLEVNLGEGVGIGHSRLDALEGISKRLPHSADRRILDSRWRCDGEVRLQTAYPG